MTEDPHENQRDKERRIAIDKRIAEEFEKDLWGWLKHATREPTAVEASTSAKKAKKQLALKGPRWWRRIRNPSRSG